MIGIQASEKFAAEGVQPVTTFEPVNIFISPVSAEGSPGTIEGTHLFDGLKATCQANGQTLTVFVVGTDYDDECYPTCIMRTHAEVVDEFLRCKYRDEVDAIERQRRRTIDAVKLGDLKNAVVNLDCCLRYLLTLDQIQDGNIGVNIKLTVDDLKLQLQWLRRIVEDFELLVALKR